MEKRGADGVFQFWKRRYFILNGSLLYYFKKKDDVDPIGFVMLQDLVAAVEGDRLTNLPPPPPGSASPAVSRDSESGRSSWAFSVYQNTSPTLHRVYNVF